MPEFQLKPEQVGELDSDGNMVSRPSQDITGAPIDALHATIKYITSGGKRYFVAIPPGRDKEDNVYKLVFVSTVKPKE